MMQNNEMLTNFQPYSSANMTDIVLYDERDEIEQEKLEKSQKERPQPEKPEKPALV